MSMTNDGARLSICISVCRIGRSYEVFDCDGNLLATSDDPVSEIARAYLQTGAPAATPLEVRHCCGSRIWLTTTVGAAAAATPFEGTNVLPFRRRTSSAINPGDAA
jgi:hypothetical protein